MISSLRKRSIKIKADERGISAVEFALILPVMIALYLGCIELTLAMNLDRKVTGATAALGDLTARSASLTDAELSDIFEATRMVLQPNDMTKAHMRVTSVSYDSTVHTVTATETEVNVDWSDNCGSEYSTLVADTTIRIPNDLVPDGGTLIMAEISFPYDSPIGYFFPSQKMLSDTFYLRPRRVDSITRTTTSAVTCGYTPPIP
ncbi:MAG: TadE/TadG family type IV pilus assembly protein [Pseudomonadota bacterium]